jgi:hypothetical protein
VRSLPPEALTTEVQAALTASGFIGGRVMRYFGMVSPFAGIVARFPGSVKTAGGPLDSKAPGP